MPELDVLEITPAMPGRTLRAAWAERRGFVWLSPPEILRPPMPLLDGPEMANDAWYRHVHAGSAATPGLGVQILPGGTVLGPGYAFSGGRFIRHDSYIPWVALQELGGTTPDLAALRPVVAEAPVIEILGPGCHVYGHWILDFLPRAIVAREVLGRACDDCLIPIPTQVPGWALTLLARVTGFRPEQALRYDMGSEYVEARDRLISPSYARRDDGCMHGLIRAVYDGLHPKAPKEERRLFCLSRSSLGADSTAPREFAQAAFLDEAAAARGFDVVHAHRMGFDAQLALYAQAGALVGEFGSAMLNALFAPRGCIIGAIGIDSPDMSRIGALCSQRNIYLTRDEEGHHPDGRGYASVSEARIEAFLDAILHHHRESLIG